MRATSALLLAGILAVSGFNPHEIFHYEFFLREELCRICYGEECVNMELTMCQYYGQTYSVMEKRGDEGEATQVDEMVYDLVEQASMSWGNYDCMPLISQYTDCTKENICTGCKTCTCNADGKWACEEEKKCRPGYSLQLSYNVLASVLESLSNYNNISSRKKRANDNNTDTTTNIVAKDIPTIDSYQQSFTKNSTDTSELDNLDFDEVLKNIANEEMSSKTKTPNDKRDQIKIIKIKDSIKFMDVLNAIEEGNESITKSNIDDTTFLVDLFGITNENKSIENNANFMEFKDIINKGINNKIDNDDVDLESLNIMKREVSSISKPNKTKETTTTESQIIAEPENDLNTSILLPLTNIIEEKQNELEDLVHIKNNLLRYIQIYHGKDANMTKEHEVVNGSNTSFSIYKLDLYPLIHNSLRSNSPTLLEKILFKLKHDIYEVLRDVGQIQKLMRLSDLPDDLKILIRSMKYYLHTQGGIGNFKNNDIKIKVNYGKNLRTLNLGSADVRIITSQLIKIFEILNKDNISIIKPLTADTNKVIKRVVNQLYANEFSPLGFKEYDSDHNLTNDLKDIGKYWSEYTSNIERSQSFNKLHAIKLLHLALCKDINKINDAISLIDYANSRRMILIETPGDDILDKINKGLNSIKNKVKKLIAYKFRHILVKNNIKDTPLRKKKQSFLKKLKNLLLGSKKDIVELTKRGVPKSEIVKTITKKRLDEIAKRKLSDYEETMMRWQNNFQVQRQKRDNNNWSLKNLSNRIKNIIPAYLRGKVNPAICKKTTSKNGKGKKPKTKKRNQLVTTTMKMKHVT